MPQTEAQRRAKKNWIEKNKEHNNALQNIYTKAYYIRNREKRLEYAKQYRDKKKLEQIDQEIETIEVELKEFI
jgi:hypothetical protein